MDTSRGDAAATTRIAREYEPRRRRGYDADSPWIRVTRLGRGSSFETGPRRYPSKDNLGLEDCPARAAALEPFQADPVLAEPLIKNFMQSIICTFSGANPAGNSCPKLIDRDYAWQLLGPNLATENEVFETAAQIHKPCYMWDGGGALPSVSLELTLGNIRNKGTKALQVVYSRRADIPLMNRGAAAGATWLLRGDESRRRDMASPWGRVAAAPRPRRGYTVETSRGGAADRDVDSPWRRGGAADRDVDIPSGASGTRPTATTP